MKIKLLLAAALSTFLVGGCATQAPQYQKIEYLTYVTAGQTMPLTQVTNIDGEQLDLTAGDKRKLVILFATWCSDSQRAMSALAESDLLKQEDLQIVAIAREQDAETVKTFQQERGLDIEFVADTDRSIYSKFANAGIPRFIMVDKDNSIIDAVIAEGENQLDLIHWR